MQGIAVVTGVVILNLFCAWILFGGGADRLEGSSLSWLTGARFTGNTSGWSAGAIKVVIGVIVFFEIVVAIGSAFQ